MDKNQRTHHNYNVIRWGSIEGFEVGRGCRVSSLPMAYLGLPLRAKFKSVRIWDDIVKRVERRFAG